VKLDREYFERFALRVPELFPGCFAGRERAIAEHACRKYSGRIGRSAVGKNLSSVEYSGPESRSHENDGRAWVMHMSGGRVKGDPPTSDCA
jgi:hypothetical protein